MDRALVDELIARFREPADFAAPIEYYREMVRTVCLTRRRRRQLHVGLRDCLSPCLRSRFGG